MAALMAACTVVGGAVAMPVAPGPGYRLLQFSENNVSWVPIAQIEEFSANSSSPHPNFFDVTDSILRSRAPRAREAVAIPQEPIHDELVRGYLEQLAPDGAFETITKLSSYFTRYYTSTTGRDAVLWLKDEYEKAAGNRPDVQIELFEHTWLQPSLVVTLYGKGDNRDETVVLGGHIDSTAGAATAEAPGADDDASGSAVVLEVFRTLMVNRYEPDRTVEFHAYAAEEVGLRGSQAVAENYDTFGRNVVSMLQMDMVGYPLNTNTPIGLTTDFVNEPLSTFVGKCITTYSRLTHQPSTCGYACSDHASWTKVNVPSCFPFESKFGTHNPAIHTKNDVVENMSRDRTNEFVKFGLGYVVELSLNP
eukprot:CAMPEP_0182923970 /NCGR_PEP_ID=MMETSP0105_2-20130417/5766_1 /TAXON_ID=81532 ORGANISM="Acanthoeca-like sp., Strain 10tr" /NCGR_SAMPLE_ID=MMETSP0105_2 /ASSEMBLY_ACC=CAM_ASM_000205 /LENGTH=363 /DNA_ID=CAMNT_0025061719 /DNA_START=22 /DNA_END=1113 /DNA_ORIENTATION=-